MQEELFSEEWTMPSAFGCERAVLQQLAHAISCIHPDETRLDDMLASVAEACLNAIEHGNCCAAGIPVRVQLYADRSKYQFRIFDLGAATMDLGQETTVAANWQAAHPRGWGLYLMRQLSDGLAVGSQGNRQYIEITFFRQEAN